MTKSYLEKHLNQVLEAGNKIFVPYIMAGDGGLDQLNEQIDFLREAGASAIEVGIPFSDPVADGDTIQQAGIRALREHVSLTAVLETLNQHKDREIPILLMTYMNPVVQYGVKAFARALTEANVSGVIVPDVPMEEEAVITDALKEEELAFIRLVALTSPKARREALKQRAEGFLYAVTVTGTTGERAVHKDEVQAFLTELKEGAPVPVLAGFGVSTPDQVKKLSQFGDGVIVGSRIVKAFHENDRPVIKTLIAAAFNS